MTRVIVRVAAGLAATALTLGSTVVLPMPAVAQPSGSDPLSGTYLLNVDLYAVAYDNPDYDGPGADFGVDELPAPLPTNETATYANQTVVDLLALGGAIRGELSHDAGPRLPWWRGPFRDFGGVSALPEDGDVRLCFKNQRATWGYFGGTDRFGVTTRIGLFRGSINFGCDPDDLIEEAELTVYAPPTGLQECGAQVDLFDDGDWVSAVLCLRNTRIDPQPAARTVGPSRGLAPFRAELDASPSEVPAGLKDYYFWNFGDGTGTAIATPRVAHIYQRPGSYPVTLTITDLAGRTRSKVVLTIESHNLPVASFTGPTNVAVGAPASFDASRSVAGNGTNGWIQWYQWTFGDGTSPVKVDRTSSVSHRFAAKGTFPVTLTVITSDGRTASTTVPITVS